MSSSVSESNASNISNTTTGKKRRINMPNYDGTGPSGKGAKTGRGMGPCGKGQKKGTGAGQGLGRGLGKGKRSQNK